MKGCIVLIMSLVSLGVFGKDNCDVKVKEWLSLNVIHFEELSEDKETSFCYVAGLVFDRLINIDIYNTFYEKLYRNKKYQETFPYFVKSDELLLVVLNENEKITDIDEYKNLEGKTIEEIFGYEGDIRLFDNQRAEATRNTLIISKDKIGNQIGRKYNTLFHEFSHLIHLSLLTEEEFFNLEQIYEKALLEDRFLDEYSKHNSSEFFAQGFEAYLSKTKKSKILSTRNHTRRDLRNKNKELYNFIKLLIKARN